MLNIVKIMISNSLAVIFASEFKEQTKVKTTKNLADEYIEQWYSQRPDVIGVIKEQEWLMSQRNKQVTIKSQISKNERV